jgi:AraC-like DNA-binding protein
MLEFHSLRLAEHLDLSQSGPSQSGSEKLHLVYAAHRGTRLELPHGWLSVWLPLRGEVELESALCRWMLQGQLLIAREGQMQGSANSDAMWLALAAPNATWKALLAPVATDAERGSDAHLDLRQLASSASYSPWHLIRMYRDVFGETPSEHIVRLRLSRAWALVRDSALPVCEITEQLGFESPSAFCRAFKNAYGLTATQARHLPALGARQASPRPSHARPRTRPAPRPLSALR